MHHTKSFLILIGAVVCLTINGCKAAKNISQSLEAMMQVRAAIIKQFGEQDVNVNINHFNETSNISVVFVNSQLNLKSPEERLNRAKETAEIVKRNYAAIKSVDNITVVFSRVTTRFVVFHWGETVDVFGFDNEARLVFGRKEAEETSVDPVELNVNYSPSRDRTEISSSAIMHEGTAENGVTCLPHISLAGEVGKDARPASEVIFDFASFGEKPRFPNLTKIAFITDGKVVYETSEQFSTSKLTDGTYSEFLFLKVSASAFRRITSGKDVTLRLGEKEYRLDERQVELLQKMSTYLKK